MNFLSELLFLKKKQNNLKFDIVNFLLQNKYCYNQLIFEKVLNYYSVYILTILFYLFTIKENLVGPFR